MCVCVCVIIIKCFPPVLAGGLSLETKWQQVFSDLHFSSEYSSLS